MLQNGIRADSRGFTGTYGRKCTGMSTGAWGRRCYQHVDGRVAGQCVGIWDAPLALDACSWLGIDRRGRRSLKGVSM